VQSARSSWRLFFKDTVLPEPIPIGSYADYPYNLKPESLAVSWSPSSTYLALTVRNSKRTWQTTLYRASPSGLKAINLPSATELVLKDLGSSSIFRWCREMPVTWLNQDLMVIHASGDAELKGKVVMYEAEATYSVSRQKLVSIKLVSVKPEEG